MLAVVHHLAGARMLVGGRAPAHERPLLDEGYTETGIREGTSRGQTSQPSARDGDVQVVHFIRRQNPRTSTLSFSRRLNWIFFPKTS